MSQNSISIYKIVEFNKDFEIIKSYWIEPKTFNSIYNGIDDVRLFSFDDQIHIIGNINNNEVQCGILKNNNFHFWEIKSDFPLHHCEKNWVFSPYKNKICIVYNWNPFVLCSFEEQHIKKLFEKKLPSYLKNIIGSSCGFVFENEIWFITHLIDSSEELNYYYHSILVFDLDYNLLRFTPYFKFKKEPVEYTLSIFVDKENIIIPISSMDKTSELHFYNKTEIERSFYQHKN